MAYTIEVTVEGTNRGLLMHKFNVQAQAEIQKKVKKSARVEVPMAEEAESYAYRLDPQNGEKIGRLCLPAEHFLQSICGCGSSLKMKNQGKKTFKDAFKGNLDVQPDYIELLRDGKPIYEFLIDSRPVRNPTTKGRIVRHRPHLQAGWQATFLISVGDDSIDLEVVQAGLEEAGRTKCVGDYRPRFGSFRIVSCKKVANNESEAA